MHDRCLDRAVLQALLIGALPPSEQAAAEHHVESCEACQTALAELADSDDVLPKQPLPAGLLEIGDSQRLSKMMRAARLDEGAPHTVVAALDTQRISIDNSPGQRARLAGRPERIGEYEVQALLGEGGIGVVYRCSDRVLGRDVAIKVLRPSLADQASLRERFLREARTAASIRHDHVVGILGIGEHAEQPYLAMEYVPGGTLADRLLRKGKLPLDEVIRLGVQVAAGLAAAHAKGIVHRDIKPGNILWDAEFSRYKLTDFGLAKALDDTSLTRTGTLVGTPEYLSPEQATGKVVDARSDLFSLGAVLYTALAGISPFAADSTIGVLHRVRNDQPPDVRKSRPDCPARLARIVERLLAKEPSQRYASAADVVAQLRQLEDAAESGALESATLRRAAGRRLRLAAITAVVLLAIAAGSFAYLARDPQVDPPATNDSYAARNGFAIVGNPVVYGGLAEAVAAARPNDVIEVHGSERWPIRPISLKSKPLVIRAAPGSRPVLVAENDERPSSPALETDADLTLSGLEIQWTAESQFAPLKTHAVLSSGGVLRVDHCEIVVGEGTGGLAVDGASCELSNSHLLAPAGTCITWRPIGGARLTCENCVLAGRCGISTPAARAADAGEPDLPASLHLMRNTWQGTKGLELLLASGEKSPLQVETTGNVFGVEHLLVLYWNPLGPRSFQTPRIGLARNLLIKMVSWQERENVYPASCTFLSWQSARQPLKAIEGGPSDLGGWEQLWNRFGSRSRQGPVPAELRGKVGADESRVGPGEAYDALEGASR